MSMVYYFYNFILLHKEGIAIIVAIFGSVFVILNYRNSIDSKKQSRNDVLFKLKNDVLIGVKKIEADWQGILNEHLRLINDISRNSKIPKFKKQDALLTFSSHTSFFEQSLLDAKAMSVDVVSKIDLMSEKEAQKLLHVFAQCSDSISRNRNEQIRKNKEVLDFLGEV
nr:hypothetical protein [uncultured Deefgea sp.]